jgi:two-component system sensor histidine kinase KdpD
MSGTLEPENTPGGGLTMVLSLPAVPAPASRPRVREEVTES